MLLRPFPGCWIFLIFVSLATPLNAIDAEFSTIKLHHQIKARGESYIALATKLSRDLSEPLKVLSKVFSDNLISARTLATQWKREYQRLKAIEAERNGLINSIPLTSSADSRTAANMVIPPRVPAASSLTGFSFKDAIPSLVDVSAG